MNNKSISVLLGILQIGLISSHGILRVPPARSTAWRERPDLFPANYNDYEMNCGGKSTQWDKNSILFFLFILIFTIINQYNFRWELRYLRRRFC